MDSLDTRVYDSSLYTRGWDDGEICINIVYVHYYLLIICGGKGMEKTLILSIRKISWSGFWYAVMDFNE